MTDLTLVTASRAEDPDLDWSQVTETVRMLNLAVAQISMAMREGEDSVQALSSSFVDLASTIEEIGGLTGALDDETASGEASAAGQIVDRCAMAQGDVQQSIVAFQFYDRLSQRLDHVRDALDRLSSLVSDRRRLFNPAEWDRLQVEIRSRYTMREEQEMFEALLRGDTVDQVLEKRRGQRAADTLDDIELF